MTRTTLLEGDQCQFATYEVASISNASLCEKLNNMLADHLVYHSQKSKSNTILSDPFKVEYHAGKPFILPFSRPPKVE